MAPSTKEVLQSVTRRIIEELPELDIADVPQELLHRLAVEAFAVSLLYDRRGIELAGPWAPKADIALERLSRSAGECFKYGRAHGRRSESVTTVLRGILAHVDELERNLNLQRDHEPPRDSRGPVGSSQAATSVA